MVQNLISSPERKNRASRRGGFTLIEILVAVAIMSLLLGIILVPLRLGFETYHIGKARAEVQQEAQLTMQQIGIDLRRAKFVFPNSYVPGVSDNTDTTSPCSVPGYKSTASWKFLPYVRSKTSAAPPDGTYGVCDNTVQAWANPARIDMLQVRRSGNSQDPTATQDFLISYYPRRLDISKPYDIVDNPVVMFRAQIPFRKNNGSGPGPDYLVGPDFNAQIDWTKYPDTLGTCNPTSEPSQTKRSFSWITHNLYGEANLEPLTQDAPVSTAPGSTVVAGAHTLATPLGMGLVAPRDANVGLSTTDPKAAEALVPELSFTEEATDGSRINRVTINMTLAQYDQAGAGSVNGQGKAQRVHVSQTFELPNAGCTP